jgi:hypothetical protein
MSNQDEKFTDWKLDQGVTTIYGKKFVSILAAFALVVSMGFAVSAISSYSVTYNASAGTTATENITEMIEDLVPSFVLLIFVMVFMLMLLTIVDRIGKH